MPLLEGSFDPTLMNATVMQSILRDRIASQLHARGVDLPDEMLDQVALDVGQGLVDDLVERGIIR